VRLKSIHDNIIEFSGADMLDGTPLLDIKPYVQAFDHIAQVTSGWVTTSLDRIKQMRSDSRFIEPDS
jgi:tRNA (Thr-GGU) A37 N-methylase